MRIQVITTLNGLGLSHDVEVLKEALPDHEISLVDWKDRVFASKADLNIFLELVNPAFFADAPRNVLVPNPEWFMAEWTRYIPRFDAVWCKTRDTEIIFRQRGGKAVFVGWSSLDRYREGPRLPMLLHVAGGSLAKGTNQVIEAMRSLPDQHLTIIAEKPWNNVPPNVTVLGRQDHDRLLELMNRHMIHLCPSSYEGFGHYVNEARSIGAVVIGTAAAPMNELVRKEYAFGVPVKTVSVQRLAQLKHVDVDALVTCIRLALSTPVDVLERIGKKARAAYLKEKDEFHTRIKELI